MRSVPFLLCCVCSLVLACGPGSSSGGSGGASAADTGGTGSGGAAGGSSSGGAGAGDGGATSGGTSSGGISSGGSPGATGGQPDSTGGGAPVEPGSALERYLQAGQPKVLYVQQVLGGLADLDATFDPQMLTESYPCERTFVGPCALSEGCEPLDTPSLDAGTISLENAGEVLVSERVDGEYEEWAGLFDESLIGGEQLVLSAAGGADLPAFEVQATFPLVVLMDSPAGDLATPIPVPTTIDLTLEFRRAPDNVVLLLEGGYWTGEAWRGIVCAGAGDPGSLVVPQQALAHVGADVELDLHTVALESVEVGDHTVHFEIRAGTTNEAREHLYKLVTQ